MKVAIVYDRVNKWGGAERVLLTLHEMFPDAPLYTSVYDEKGAPWAKVFPKIITSFLQKVPRARRNHEYLPLLMPLAFESFNFDGYDLVISVTSEAAKGIITKGHTKHISYCLTPTRYLWSHYDEYLGNGNLKKISKPAISYLRKWDLAAAARPDILVGISTVVQGRIKKYYGRESEIIFPPVDDLKFNTKVKKNSGDYFLIVSRLVNYKKVDLAIEAFNELGLPLYIVGVGREEGRLKRMAKKNVKFLGKLTDNQLFTYYKGASALLFPQEEDFGLVAVEAQSTGTPVIAFKKGGALDTVIEGVTGIFFEDSEVSSLISAIERFKKSKLSKDKITKNAKRFSKEKFKKEFEKLI